jgi:hypothetical protein
MYGNRSFYKSKNGLFINYTFYGRRNYNYMMKTYRIKRVIPPPDNICDIYSDGRIRSCDAVINDYIKLFREYNDYGIKILKIDIYDKLNDILSSSEFDNLIYDFFQDKIIQKKYLSKENIYKFFKDVYDEHLKCFFHMANYRQYDLNYFDGDHKYKYIYNYCEILLISLIYDSTELLEYIFNYDRKCFDPIIIMTNYCLQKCEPYSEYSRYISWDDLYYDIAIRENKINMVKFIHKNANKNEYIKKHSVEINKDIKEKIILACLNGNLEIAEYLYKNYEVKITYEYFEAVSKTNNISIYKWLIKNYDGKHILSDKHFKEACISRNLDMIELLWPNRDHYNILNDNGFILKLIDLSSWKMIKYIFLQKLYFSKKIICDISLLFKNYLKGNTKFLKKYFDENYGCSIADKEHGKFYLSIYEEGIDEDHKDIAFFFKNLNNDDINNNYRSKMILYRRYIRINILKKSS